MKLLTKKLETRILLSSIIAGVGDILLRLLTHLPFFGYLGVSLILYGVAHYVLIKMAERRHE